MAPGTADNPLRVAVFGSGPAAFYAVEHLIRQPGLSIQVDMFDRLPTPYGLVRFGVAPDHPKIKSVTKVFEKIASNPNFRFFGNVEFGKHLTLDEVRDRYHQVLFATGAQSDRRMGIPGEDLIGSHPATEFVAWYNGHPDFRDCQFDLSQKSAAVIGVGNVAIDVARMLCHTQAELAQTDVADYALQALANSGVEDVYLCGRRGPAQAAFTNPEIKEVGELEDADVIALPDGIQLDELSKAEVAGSNDPALVKKVEILQGYAARTPAGKPRRLHIRFLVSPVELVGDANGRVVKMRMVRNILYKTESGSLSAKPTEEFFEVPVGLVFRSVGYRGVPLPGVPFNERYGVILNEKGRVMDPQSVKPMVGLYTAGWIKRGPSGVIGTNKPDSVETVNGMLQDLQQGLALTPRDADARRVQALVRERQPNVFTFADWLRLDQIEVSRGQAQSRPRVKFTRVSEMLAALGR